MSFLKIFNKKLVEFLEDLLTIYPDDRDLKKAKMGLPMLTQTNPRLTVEYFKANILPHKDQIMNKDSDGLLKLANEKLEQDQLGAVFSKINQKYQEMSDANREVVWKYAQVLVMLCERC